MECCTAIVLADHAIRAGFISPVLEVPQSRARSSERASGDALTTATTTSGDSGESELGDLRDEVAETTKDIIRLVAKRAELSRKIGELKSRDSLPDRQRARWRTRSFEDIVSECKALGLDVQLGTKILNTLVAESKKVQRMQSKGSSQPLITPMVMMAKAKEIEKTGGS